MIYLFHLNENTIFLYFSVIAEQELAEQEEEEMEAPQLITDATNADS